MHFEIEMWQTWRLLQGSVSVCRSILVLSLGVLAIGVCKAVMGEMSTLYKMLLHIIILLSSSRSVLADLAGWIHDSLYNEQEYGFLLASVSVGISIFIFSLGLKLLNVKNHS